MDLIDTPRLKLQMMGKGDEALYCRLYGDAQVMRHIAGPLPHETARRSFAIACCQAAERPMRRPWWVIREHGRGDAGIVGLVLDREEPEIGVVLAPEAQARGLAVEAMDALARAAFATGLASRLWLRHAPGNVAMAAVASRLGATRAQDGTGPDACRWSLCMEMKSISR